MSRKTEKRGVMIRRLIIVTNLNYYGLFILIFFLFLLFPPLVRAYAVSIEIEKIRVEKFPEIELMLHINPPPREVLDEKSFRILENNKPVEGTFITPQSAERLPLKVVILVDTSGSMRGIKLDEARRACEMFINKKKDLDDVAIVSFSNSAVVLQPFSEDKNSLLASLKRLDAQGNTALFDGIIKASKLFPGKDNEAKVLIIISDGKDTKSKAKDKDAEAACLNAGVKVFFISIGSSFERKIADLTVQTGGKYFIAPNEKDVEEIFETVTSKIFGRYLVRFKSKIDKDGEVRIRIGIVSEGKVYWSVPAIVNIEKIQPRTRSGNLIDGKSKTPVLPDYVVYLIPFLILLSVSLLSWSTLSLIFSTRNSVIEKLRRYEDALKISPASDSSFSQRGKLNLKEKFSLLLRKLEFEDALKGRIDRAGLKLRTSEFAWFHMIFVILMGLTGSLVAGYIGVLIFSLVGSFLPFVFLDSLAFRRSKKFESQLPEALRTLSHLLRAGYSIPQAFKIASEESLEPLRSEFGRVVRENQLGLSIEEAMSNLAKRINNQSLDWTVTAINIQKDVGGNLADVLDRIASTIKQREIFRKQISALSAEGRLSAVILISLPFVEAAILFLIAPSYILLLFRTVIGIVMLALAAILLIIGTVWLKKIISVEF